MFLHVMGAFPLSFVLHAAAFQTITPLLKTPKVLTATGHQGTRTMWLLETTVKVSSRPVGC